MRNSYRFAVILPGWSGHKLPSESSVQRKQTTEHETAQTSNTGGSITVMSHLPPLTYALSVHSFCELRSQRKTTTLSSSLAAVLLASRSTYHHQNYNIIFITGRSTAGFMIYLSPSKLQHYLHHWPQHCWLHDLLITIKTTTLSSSLAAALLASRSTYHHQNYNIIFIIGRSTAGFTIYLSPSKLQHYLHHWLQHIVGFTVYLSPSKLHYLHHRLQPIVVFKVYLSPSKLQHYLHHWLQPIVVFTVYLSPSLCKAHVLGSTSLLLSSLCIHFLVGVFVFCFLSCCHILPPDLLAFSFCH